MFQNLAGGSQRVLHLCELARWKFAEHFNIHPHHVQDEWIKKVVTKCG